MKNNTILEDNFLKIRDYLTNQIAIASLAEVVDYGEINNLTDLACWANDMYLQEVGEDFLPIID